MEWPHGVDVSANVGYLSACTAALSCHIASFEPNKDPRCYLEASAALARPASPQMDDLLCGNWSGGK